MRICHCTSVRVGLTIRLSTVFLWRRPQAHRRGYRYPRYLFFMIPWYVSGWWRFEPDSYGCTVAERETTLEFSITVMNLPFAIYLNESTVTETGGGLVSFINNYYIIIPQYFVTCVVGPNYDQDTMQAAF